MDLNNPAILLTLLDEPEKRERLRELLVQQAHNEEILKAAKDEKEEAERVHEKATALHAEASKRHAQADDRHSQLAEWERGISNANESMNEEKDRFDAIRQEIEANLSGRLHDVEEKEDELTKRETAVSAKEQELTAREKALEELEADHNARVLRLKKAIG